MNDVDRKVYYNNKEIEELKSKLKSKMLELEKSNNEIKNTEEELTNLKKSNKKNFSKKMLNLFKLFIMPYLIIFLLGSFISNYFYLLFIITSLIFIFKIYKDTMYERYNLSNESIERTVNIKNQHENNKKDLDIEIEQLMLKIYKLTQENLSLNIESKELKEKDDDLLIEIEKHLRDKKIQ